MDSKQYLGIAILCMVLTGVILFFDTFYGVYDELSYNGRTIDLEKNRSYDSWMSVEPDENFEGTYKLRNNKFSEAKIEVEIRIESVKETISVLKSESLSIGSMGEEEMSFGFNPQVIGLESNKHCSFVVYWNGEKKREVKLNIIEMGEIDFER